MASPHQGSRQHVAGRRRVLATLACVIALATLTACTTAGHEPEPIDDWESPGTGKPRQHGDPGVAGPKAQDSEQDAAPGEPIPDDHAALEAVRAWIRAETTAYRGGSRERLRAMATSDCTACEKTLDDIADVYADGGRLGGQYTESITFIQGVTGTSPPVVQAIVDRSVRIQLDADGEERKRVPASTEVLEFSTAKEGDRWLIADITSAAR